MLLCKRAIEPRLRAVDAARRLSRERRDRRRRRGARDARGGERAGRRRRPLHDDQPAAHQPGLHDVSRAARRPRFRPRPREPRSAALRRGRDSVGGAGVPHDRAARCATTFSIASSARSRCASARSSARPPLPPDLPAPADRGGGAAAFREYRLRRRRSWATHSSRPNGDRASDSAAIQTGGNDAPLRTCMLRSCGSPRSLAARRRPRRCPRSRSKATASRSRPAAPAACTTRWAAAWPTSCRSTCPGLQATAEVTGGSVDNLKLINAGKSEVALLDGRRRRGTRTRASTSSRTARSTRAR